MKKIKFIPVLCCMLLASCGLVDFSEDCVYDGNLDIRLNWNYLLEGDKQPREADLLIYTLPVRSHTISGDTILKQIPEGIHTLLALNKPDGVQYNLDEADFATATLPVSTQDEKRYIGQAPIIYADKKEATIVAGQTTQCEIIPVSCIRQVIIDFVISDNGVALEVDKISGELSGVQYGYSFARMEAIPSDAVLQYTSKQQKPGLFRSSNIVFGMNPDKDSKTAPDNILEVDLRLSDGTYHHTIIDLTKQFEGFMSPLIHITLEVRLGLLGMEAEVTGWQTGEEGNIEI